MKLLLGNILACSLALTSTTTALAQSSRNPIACGQGYTITRGDTLSRISLRAYVSIRFQPLYRHNVATIGADPNRIVVGQTLEVPCFAADGSVISTPTPAVETTPAPAVEPETAIAEADAAPDSDAAVENETVVLTFNKTSAPPFIINSGIIDLYLDEITEVTEGRVQFVDPEPMNRDQAAQFDLVTSGAVDGAYVLNANLSASHPLLQLPMLPLMGGSAEQTAVSLWRLHDQFLADTNYFDDAQLLGFVAAPAAHIWRKSTAPVTATEGVVDKNVYAVPYFEGLDIRGPKVLREEVAEWMKDYTARNTTPPTFFLAHGAARALGIWNDSMTVTEVDYGLYTPTYSVILSNDAWARISDADQEAILAVSGEKLSARSASWDAFDNGFRADMVQNGLKIVKADDALLRALRDYKLERLEEWNTYATAMNIPASSAVNFYQENLRSLEDRLLFR